MTFDLVAAGHVTGGAGGEGLTMGEHRDRRKRRTGLRKDVGGRYRRRVVGRGRGRRYQVRLVLVNGCGHVIAPVDRRPYRAEKGI